MGVAAILVFCAQALLAQLSLGQCLGPNAAFAPFATGWAYDGFGAPELALPGNAWAYGGSYGAYSTGCGAIAASGGALPIDSNSPFAPAGLFVRSDNAVEGIVTVSGQLPFVSAVALEGALPTVGAGSIAYGCGDGTIGVVSEIGIVGTTYPGLPPVDLITTRAGCGFGY